MASEAEFGFVDLFSGGGGASCGARLAVPGVRILLAAEMDGQAVTTYRTQFRPNILIHEQMHLEDPAYRTSLVDMLVAMTSTEITHVHIHASPPCQGFSKARKYNIVPDDPRNETARWTLHTIMEMRSALLSRTGVRTVSWSLENVVQAEALVTAVAHDLGLAPVIFNDKACFFGAATDRRRLFMGEGWVPPPRRSDRPSVMADLVLKVRSRRCTEERFLPEGVPADHLAVNLSGGTLRDLTTGKNVRKDFGAGQGLRPTTRPFGTFVRRGVNPQAWQLSDETGRWSMLGLLTIDSIAQIQGFPPGYFGDARHRVTSIRSQIGNSVVPPLMADIVRQAVLAAA